MLKSVAIEIIWATHISDSIRFVQSVRLLLSDGDKWWQFVNVLQRNNLLYEY